MADFYDPACPTEDELVVLESQVGKLPLPDPVNLSEVPLPPAPPAISKPVEAIPDINLDDVPLPPSPPSPPLTRRGKKRKRNKGKQQAEEQPTPPSPPPQRVTRRQSSLSHGTASLVETDPPPVPPVPPPLKEAAPPPSSVDIPPLPPDGLPSLHLVPMVQLEPLPVKESVAQKLLNKARSGISGNDTRSELPSPPGLGKGSQPVPPVTGKVQFSLKPQLTPKSKISFQIKSMKKAIVSSSGEDDDDENDAKTEAVTPVRFKVAKKHEMFRPDVTEDEPNPSIPQLKAMQKYIELLEKGKPQVQNEMQSDIIKPTIPAEMEVSSCGGTSLAAQNKIVDEKTSALQNVVEKKVESVPVIYQQKEERDIERRRSSRRRRGDASPERERERSLRHRSEPSPDKERSSRRRTESSPERDRSSRHRNDLSPERDRSVHHRSDSVDRERPSRHRNESSPDRERPSRHRGEPSPDHKLSLRHRSNPSPDRDRPLRHRIDSSPDREHSLRRSMRSRERRSRWSPSDDYDKHKGDTRDDRRRERYRDDERRDRGKEDEKRESRGQEDDSKGAYSGRKLRSSSRIDFKQQSEEMYNRRKSVEKKSEETDYGGQKKDLKEFPFRFSAGEDSSVTNTKLGSSGPKDKLVSNTENGNKLLGKRKCQSSTKTKEEIDEVYMEKVLSIISGHDNLSAKAKKENVQLESEESPAFALDEIPIPPEPETSVEQNPLSNAKQKHSLNAEKQPSVNAEVMPMVGVEQRKYSVEEDQNSPVSPKHELVDSGVLICEAVTEAVQTEDNVSDSGFTFKPFKMTKSLRSVAHIKRSANNTAEPNTQSEKSTDQLNVRSSKNSEHDDSKLHFNVDSKYKQIPLSSVDIFDTSDKERGLLTKIDIFSEGEKTKNLVYNHLISSSLVSKDVKDSSASVTENVETVCILPSNDYGQGSDSHISGISEKECGNTRTLPGETAKITPDACEILGNIKEKSDSIPLSHSKKHLISLSEVMKKTVVSHTSPSADNNSSEPDLGHSNSHSSAEHITDLKPANSDFHYLPMDQSEITLPSSDQSEAVVSNFDQTETNFLQPSQSASLPSDSHKLTATPLSGEENKIVDANNSKTVNFETCDTSLTEKDIIEQEGAENCTDLNLLQKKESVCTESSLSFSGEQEPKELLCHLPESNDTLVEQNLSGKHSKKEVTDVSNKISSEDHVLFPNRDLKMSGFDSVKDASVIDTHLSSAAEMDDLTLSQNKLPIAEKNSFQVHFGENVPKTDKLFPNKVSETLQEKELTESQETNSSDQKDASLIVRKENSSVLQVNSSDSQEEKIIQEEQIGIENFANVKETTFPEIKDGEKKGENLMDVQNERAEDSIKSDVSEERHNAQDFPVLCVSGYLSEVQVDKLLNVQEGNISEVQLKSLMDVQKGIPTVMQKGTEVTCPPVSVVAADKVASSEKVISTHTKEILTGKAKGIPEQLSTVTRGSSAEGTPSEDVLAGTAEIRLGELAVDSKCPEADGKLPEVILPEKGDGKTPGKLPEDPEEPAARPAESKLEEISGELPRNIAVNCTYILAELAEKKIDKSEGEPEKMTADSSHLRNLAPEEQNKVNENRELVVESAHHLVDHMHSEVDMPDKENKTEKVHNVSKILVDGSHSKTIPAQSEESRLEKLTEVPSEDDKTLSVMESGEQSKGTVVNNLKILEEVCPEMKPSADFVRVLDNAALEAGCQKTSESADEDKEEGECDQSFESVKSGEIENCGTAPPAEPKTDKDWPEGTRKVEEPVTEVSVVKNETGPSGVQTRRSRRVSIQKAVSDTPDADEYASEPPPPPPFPAKIPQRRRSGRLQKRQQETQEQDVKEQKESLASSKKGNDEKIKPNKKDVENVLKEASDEVENEKEKSNLEEKIMEEKEQEGIKEKEAAQIKEKTETERKKQEELARKEKEEMQRKEKEENERRDREERDRRERDRRERERDRRERDDRDRRERSRRRYDDERSYRDRDRDDRRRRDRDRDDRRSDDRRSRDRDDRDRSSYRELRSRRRYDRDYDRDNKRNDRSPEDSRRERETKSRSDGKFVDEHNKFESPVQNVQKFSEATNLKHRFTSQGWNQVYKSEGKRTEAEEAATSTLVKTEDPSSTSSPLKPEKVKSRWRRTSEAERMAETVCFSFHKPPFVPLQSEIQLQHSGLPKFEVQPQVIFPEHSQDSQGLLPCQDRGLPAPPNQEFLPYTDSRQSFEQGQFPPTYSGSVPHPSHQLDSQASAVPSWPSSVPSEDLSSCIGPPIPPYQQYQPPTPVGPPHFSGAVPPPQEPQDLPESRPSFPHSELLSYHEPTNFPPQEPTDLPVQGPREFPTQVPVDFLSHAPPVGVPPPPSVPHAPLPTMQVPVPSDWLCKVDIEVPVKQEPQDGYGQISSNFNNSAIIPSATADSSSTAVQEFVLDPGQKTPNDVKSEVIAKPDEGRESVEPVVLVPKVEEKPPHYEDLTENIYLTDRRKSKQMRRMICDCTYSIEDQEMGIEACGDDCLNRMLLIECGSRCPCAEHCTNKRFQKRIYSEVRAFFTGNKGWGLQAMDEFEVGAFVIEYVGEVLDFREFKNRTKQYAKCSVDHYYFMALNADEVIDATLKGNVSRFINHSCDPNCETQKWTVNGELRIGFFTRRTIALGEELTFDYQFERYGEEAQKCYCGSENCRGVIGGTKTTPVKKKKDSKVVDRKKKELFEDESLEEDIEKMMNLEGLRNREHVLNLCRLMVRAEEVEHRLDILKIIEDTTEQACLRLFLDYHGLPLLWSWMAESGQETDELKIQILSTLKLLPINNKTVLKESKILSVVRRLAGKNESVSEPPADSTPVENEADSNSDPPPTPVSILASNKDSKERPHKKRVTFADEATSSDSDLSDSNRITSTQPGNGPPDSSFSDISYLDFSESDGYLDFEEGSERIKPENADDSGNKESLKTETLSQDADSNMAAFGESTKQGKPSGVKEEGRVDCKHDDGNKEAEAVTVKLTDTGSQPQNASPDDAESDSKVESSAMDTDEKESEIKQSECKGSESEIHDGEKVVEESEEQKPGLEALAAELLETWSSLKELFKIPKKQRVEERKRVERELDVRFKEKHNRYKVRKRERRRIRDKEREEQEAILLNPNRPRKTLLPTPPQMTKEERRQLFEAQVRAQDEMAAEIQRQQEEYFQQQYAENPNYDPQFDPNLAAYYQQLDPNYVISDSSITPQAAVPHPASFLPVTDDPELDSNAQYGTLEGPYQPDPAAQYGRMEGLLPPDPVYHHPDQVQQQQQQQQQQALTTTYVEPYVEPSQPQVVYQQPSYQVQPGFSQQQTQGTVAPPQGTYIPGQQVYYTTTPQGVVVQQTYSAPQPNVVHVTDQNIVVVQQVQQLQNLLQMQQSLSALTPTTVAPSVPTPTEEDIPPPPSPPQPKQPQKLPPNWKTARDAEGRTYYYHSGTRQTQWDPPTWEQGESHDDMDLGTPTFDDYVPSKFKKKTTTAAADTSSEVAKKIKDQFRHKMSQFVVTCLNPYRKPDCKSGRIASTDDFKHLARKLTHHVMAKELKHCRHVEDLEVNENVKAKAKDYVRKYMSRFGSTYKKDMDDNF